MAFVINVRNLQRLMKGSGYDLDSCSPKDFPATDEHIYVLGEILDQMAQGRRKDAYSNYLPHLHLECTPKNRLLVGQVLGFLWAYCFMHMLPELNYLLVEKPRGDQDISESLPGKYMQGAWKDNYGTMRGFRMYSARRSTEATKMLDSGLVVINCNKMIRRPSDH